MAKAYRVGIIHGDGHIVFHQNGDEIDACISKIAEKVQREISRVRER
jgi:hypothetical protein